MISSVLSGKIRSLLWFLKRPSLYPQLLHLIRLRLLAPEEDTSREASLWCSGRAMDSGEALARITGQRDLPTLRKIHESVFEGAEKRSESCPVKMGGPGAVDLLYHLTEYLAATRVIETGVAYGWSSLALLASLQNRKGASLISTDMPYLKMDNEKWVGCVVPEEWRDQWRIIRLADRQALPEALVSFGEIDLCHYDSDKSYDGRRWAYPLLWKKLRSGGIFISDDIGDNFAFRDFVAALDVEPVITRLPITGGMQYVGVLIKP